MGIVRTRSTATTLLLVDDDPDTQRIGKMLRSKGFRVRVAQSADRALDKSNLYMADVAVIDMKLGDKSAREGLALARQIREINPSLPLVGMSAFLTAFEGPDREVNIDHWLAAATANTAARVIIIHTDKVGTPPTPSTVSVADAGAPGGAAWKKERTDEKSYGIPDTGPRHARGSQSATPSGATRS